MKKTLGLAAVVVVALTGASAAYAAPGSGDTEIYACRVKTTGVLRIIDKGKHCSTSETAMSWARTGPAGKQGAPGVAGPKGASPVLYVRESTVPLPPSVVTIVPAVTCDPVTRPSASTRNGGAETLRPSPRPTGRRGEET